MSQQVLSEDTDASAEVALAGDLPHFNDYRISPDLVMLADPNGSRAEAIRALRTHIMAQHIQDGRRGLTICGASPDVGASFLAANLAVALAQVGVKTLLIDADMRHPQIGQFFQTTQADPGLIQHLSTHNDLSSIIRGDVVENLSIIFSGGTAVNAQELLAGDVFASTIARCLRDYDLTIVDTPPANSCADARRISTVIGYSLIVAKRHVSFVSDIRTLADQLREDRAQVIGSVMNEP